MKKTFYIGLFLAIFSFIAAAGMSISKMAAQKAITAERAHAFQVNAKIEGLISLLQEAENALGNYTKSREPRYLDTYNAAVGETFKRRDELRTLFSDGHETSRFEELFVLVDSRIEVLKELLESAGARPETQFEILSREEQIHDSLIQTSRDLEKEETSEVVAYDAKLESISKQSIFLALAGTFLSIVIFSGLFCRFYRELKERKRLELAMERQAYYDLLTGLPNRLSFMERLDYETQQANRSRNRLAVVYLDVDRFKEVNDTLGHEAGDALLKDVAVRLRAGIRKSDSVARIGGDEFNILLTNISDSAAVSRTVEKILDSFRPPFLISGQEIQSSCSIGISVYPDDGEDSGILLKNADIAMYHAKEQGRNNYKFYNASLNRRIQHRAMIENNLRHTIEKNELLLRYQPRIDIREKRVVSGEAFVRWKHPEKGLLNPLEFIPIAEGMAFISALDEWVLGTACGQARTWRDRAAAAHLAVNVSSRWFKRSDIVDVASQIVQKEEFDPHRLVLEISEKAAMEDIGNMAAKLDELESVGIGVAIDHFGTGPSSLSDLKVLSLARIKIDKSFIKAIEFSRNDRAMIRTMIAMAHNMGIRIVAEGVETLEELRFLEENGCDEAQGFYICRPVSSEEFAKFAVSYGGAGKF